MVEVRTYSQLLNEIEKARDKALKDVGEDIEDVVKEEIDKTVYSSYSPTKYRRTGELRESVDSEVGNGEIEIKHDTGKIHASSPNQHMSVINDSDVSDAIPEIVHDGLAPNIFNDSHYVWEDKRPYMDNAKKRLKSTNEHVSSMKKSLKKQGFNVR